MKKALMGGRRADAKTNLYLIIPRYSAEFFLGWAKLFFAPFMHNFAPPPKKMESCIMI